MMTMDIGLYGQHPHNNTYNTNEHHHHNDVNPTSNPYISETLTSPYQSIYQPEDLNPPCYEDSYHQYYYHNSNPNLDEAQQHYYHPDSVLETHPPIINSDNGLSYTNLDYGSSNSSTPSHFRSYDQGFTKNEQSEVEYNGMHHSELLHQQYPSSNSTSPCMDYHHYKEEMRFSDQQGHFSGMMHLHNGMSGGSGQLNHQQHGMGKMGMAAAAGNGAGSPSQQTTLTPVPTYKWMQVKRNVPKPSGKFLIIFICITAGA